MHLDSSHWRPGDPRTHLVLGLSIALGALSFTAVILRFISRHYIRKRISIDDWLILIAWVMAAGLSTALCINVKTSDAVVRRKTRYVYIVIYNPTAAMVKTSILVYYKALFKRYDMVKWIVWATLLVVNIGALALAMLFLFECKPLSVSFDMPNQLPPHWHCIDPIKIAYANSPFHIVTDFAIILIPMPILARLNLPLKQKVMLMCLFGLGGFVALMQIGRAYYFQKAVQDADFSWNDVISYLWVSMTIHVGIVVVSSPMLKPLFSDSRCLYKLFSEYYSMDVSQRSSTTTSRSAAPLQLEDRSPSFSFTDQSSERPELHRISSFLREDRSTGSGPTDDGPQLHRIYSFLQEDRSNSFSTMQEVPDMPPLHRMASLGLDRDFSAYQTTRSAMPLLILMAGPFFLQGLSFGVLDLMHKKFEAITTTTDGEALGLHSAYYGAFALAALTFPGWIFRRHGFKITIAVGLFTYGVGCMVFWPSSITQTFPGLLFSMIIIGTGSGIIDLSSSTFVVLLGPQEYAEVRLNIFQGIQAVGGLMPLLSQSTAFYASVSTMGFSTLLVVQWLFLGCGYAAFFMAGVICCVRLPEFQDPEPPFRSSSKSLFRSPYGLGFFLALWALFFYCGGQEITRIYARNYLVLGIHTTNELALRLEKSGQAVFAAGRFIAAILMLLVRPRWLLLAFTLGLLIVSAIAITHSALQGDIVYALNLFFQGTIYPTIFVLAIRGVGRHIKTAAILLVAALGMGAAVLPIVFYPVNKKEGTMQATAITIAAFGALLVYPLYLCAVPAERERTKRFDDELDGLFFWKTCRSSESVAGFGIERRRSI